MLRTSRKTLIAACTALALGAGGVSLAQGAPAPGQSGADPYVETPGEARAPLSASASGAGARAAGGYRRATPGGKKKLAIGFGDFHFVSSDAGLRTAVMNEAVAANAGVVRLYVSWRNVAPSSPSPAFNAADPGSPEYSWGSIDAAVRDAAQRGLRVLLLVNEAPGWAEGANRPNNVIAGTWKPSPNAFADFGTAIARRYSGNFAGLPQVRDYIAWNEPNLETNLTPVWKGKSGKKPASSGHYKKMLNRFYGAVRKVSRKNRVITGGTAPYGADPGVLNMRPRQFWREVMCVKGNGKAQRRCKDAKFDVLAHHPINTSGGPRRSAIHPDDVSTPDLRHLVDVLRTAEKAGNVKPKGKHEVWAPELWWESDPPDPSGIPLQKHARYYTEALYLLWKQGASLVLPYQVRDDGFNGTPGRTSFETGAYFVDGAPKPARDAIAFPFLADRKSKKKVLLWGKAPRSGRLAIEVKRGGKFRTLTRSKARRGRIFRETVKLRGKRKLRATIGGATSPPWKVR